MRGIKRDKNVKNEYARDWKRYGWAYVLHVLEGFITGSVAMLAVVDKSIPLSVIAFMFCCLYIAYQGLSFARKWDTVGIDMVDYSIGVGLGVLAFWGVSKVLLFS